MVNGFWFDWFDDDVGALAGVTETLGVICCFFDDGNDGSGNVFCSLAADNPITISSSLRLRFSLPPDDGSSTCWKKISKKKTTLNVSASGWIGEFSLTYAVVLFHQFRQHIIQFSFTSKRGSYSLFFRHRKVLYLGQIDWIFQHVGHVNFRQTENVKNKRRQIGCHTHGNRNDRKQTLTTNQSVSMCLTFPV